MLVCLAGGNLAGVPALRGAAHNRTSPAEPVKPCWRISRHNGSCALLVKPLQQSLNCDVITR
jgi:hypothetical protein